MSDDAILSDSDGAAPVVRRPRIGKPPEPDKFRLAETGTLLHRGLRYVTRLVEDDTWEVRGEDGTMIGSIVIVSPAGEEGEAVYGARLSQSHEVIYEGTDWRSLAAGIINEARDAEA
jgi:hypothetical protein